MDSHDDLSGSPDGWGTPAGDTSHRVREPMRAPRKTRFGGRAARYMTFRQTLLTAYDPLKHTEEMFANDGTLNAWLVRRFDPQVTDLVVRPQPVAYLRLGTRFGAQPDFSYKLAGADSTTLEWVCPEWEPEQRPRYEHFKVTHGVDVVLTGSRDLELLEETLVDNLQHALQVMTMTRDEDLASITQAILTAVPRKGATSRGDLGASLTFERKAACADCFDAALFHLHCAGALQLSLRSHEYDDHTTITRV